MHWILKLFLWDSCSHGLQFRAIGDLEKAGFVDDLKGNKKLFDYVLAIANKNASKIKQGEWFVVPIKGPKGKITTMTQWQKLGNGKLYLKTIKIF